MLDGLPTCRSRVRSVPNPPGLFSGVKKEVGGTIIGTWFVQLQTNKIQALFKDFSRRKTTFQGPMFIQYIKIFVPFFTPKTLNSVITYIRFSNSSALVDEVSLCNEILTVK